ncbi:hypothetical protein Hanom_Chr12g01093071 [Helianthus anomalus]
MRFWNSSLCAVTVVIIASLVVTKTTIFIRKVSLLIYSRLGKQTGFTRAPVYVGESLSVGVTSRVMVTRAQAWCEIWDHTP